MAYIGFQVITIEIDSVCRYAIVITARLELDLVSIFRWESVGVPVNDSVAEDGSIVTSSMRNDYIHSFAHLGYPALVVIKNHEIPSMEGPCNTIPGQSKASVHLSSFWRGSERHAPKSWRRWGKANKRSSAVIFKRWVFM